MAASSGSAVTAEIVPAAVALPVTSSTNQGKATIVMPLAVPDRTVVVSRAS
jgi:hypothetical protein